MPKPTWFPFGSGSTNRRNPTAPVIGEPTDFRVVARHADTPAPAPLIERWQFLLNEIEGRRAENQQSPAIPGARQSDDASPLEQAIGAHVPEAPPRLPFLEELQSRMRATGSVSSPPLPQRMASLSTETRDDPPPLSATSPVRLHDLPERPRPLIPDAPPDAVASMPIATGANEIRSAGRVRDMAAVIDRGERPLAGALERAPFI